MVLLLSNLTTEQFIAPVLLSLQVAILALLIVFVLATAAARFMARAEFRVKGIIETLLMLPLVLPPTVVGVLLIMIFGNNGFIGDLYETLFGGTIMFTWYAAVIASTVVAFPLMYQSAKAGFLNVDADIENAAKVDGANRLQTFIKIGREHV